MSVDVPKVLLRPREKQKNRKTVRLVPMSIRRCAKNASSKNRKQKNCKAGPNARRRAKSAPSIKNRKTVRLVPQCPSTCQKCSFDLEKNRKTVRLVPMSIRRCAKNASSKNRKQKNCKAGPNARRRAKSAPSIKNRKTVRLVPQCPSTCQKCSFDLEKNRKTVLGRVLRLKVYKIKYIFFKRNYMMLNHDYKLLSKERCTYKFGPIFMYLENIVRNQIISFMSQLNK